MQHYMTLAPLENLARERHQGTDDDFSDNIFSDIVGVSNRAISRWRAAGGRIPWQTADVAALSMGLHPSHIWPDEWRALDEGLLDGSDPRAGAQVEKALEAVGKVLAERGPIWEEPEWVKRQRQERSHQLGKDLEDYHTTAAALME